MAGETNTGVDAAARRVEEVRARMAETTRRAQARVKRFGVIAVVLSVLLAVYFVFAYTQFIHNITAELAMTTARKSIQDNYLGDVQHSMSDSLKQKAPDVVAAGGSKLLEMPGAMKGMLTDFIVTKIDTQMAATRDEFYTTVKAQLGPIAQKVKDANPSASDEQRLNLILDEVAKAYRKSADQQIDEMYKKYSPQTADLSDYLQTLSKGQGLSTKEELHRKLIVTFMALVQKLENEGTIPAVPRVASN